MDKCNQLHLMLRGPIILFFMGIYAVKHFCEQALTDNSYKWFCWFIKGGQRSDPAFASVLLSMFPYCKNHLIPFNEILRKWNQVPFTISVSSILGRIKQTQDFVPVSIPSCFIPFLTHGFLMVDNCFQITYYRMEYI